MRLAGEPAQRGAAGSTIRALRPSGMRGEGVDAGTGGRAAAPSSPAKMTWAILESA